MLKISNFEVLGWEHAIRGMRNPMNSWEKSDSCTKNASPIMKGGNVYELFSSSERPTTRNMLENAVC